MRAIKRKRPPLMTVRRWLLIFILAVAALIVWFSFYFYEIQKPKWTEVNAIQAIATESEPLSHVLSVNKHVWDEQSWVVAGINDKEEEVYVFLKNNEKLFSIKAEDSISPDALRQKLLQTKPDASIRHIRPGLFYSQPVWEINYTLSSDQQFYYEFYTFEQGTWIDMYRMPAKTRR